MVALGTAPACLARALSACLVVAGCTTSPTQIVVHVNTDLEVGPEIDGFAARVWGPGNELVLDRAFPLVGPTKVTLPATFGVAPAGGDPGRSVRIAASALRPNAAPGTLEASARTSYVEHEVLRLDLYLSRACIGVLCPAEQTCRASTCVPELVDPETLPREGEDVPDASPPDAARPEDAASFDAAQPDAGSEPSAVTTVFAVRGELASVQDVMVALDQDGTAAVAAVVAGEVEVDGDLVEVDGTWGTLVARIDVDGAVLWSRWVFPLDPASYAIATAIAADPEGRIVVVGQNRGGLTIPGSGDFATNGPADTPAVEVVFEPDGSVAPGSPVLDVWNGGVLELLDLDITAQGEMLLTGQFQGTIDLTLDRQIVDQTGSGSVLTARYDAAGTLLQACTLSGGAGVAIQGLDDGGHVAAGQFSGTSDHGLVSHGLLDAFAIRYGTDCSDAIAPPVFAHAVGGSGLDQHFGIAADGAGRIYVVGSYGELDVAIDDGPSLGLDRPQDGLLVAFEPDGATAFHREIGGDGVDFLTAIATRANGDLWIAGVGGAFEMDDAVIHNAGNSDALVLRMSPEGVVRWGKNLGGAGTDLATDLAADRLRDEVVVAGWAAGPAELGDAVVPADAVLGVFVVRLAP